MVTRASVDDLRKTVTNLKHTRHSASRSMHRWLDNLIADAEADLRRLSSPDADAAAPTPGHAAPTPAPRTARSAPSAATPNPRSTYPFDEHAPWQRAS